VNYLGVLLIM